MSELEGLFPERYDEDNLGFLQGLQQGRAEASAQLAAKDKRIKSLERRLHKSLRCLKGSYYYSDRRYARRMLGEKADE